MCVGCLRAFTPRPVVSVHFVIAAVHDYVVSRERIQPPSGVDRAPRGGTAERKYGPASVWLTCWRAVPLGAATATARNVQTEHARKQTVWQGRHRGCALSEEDSL